MDIRNVGERSAKKKDTVLLKPKTNIKKKIRVKDLSFKPSKKFQLKNFKQRTTRVGKESLLQKRKERAGLKSLSINNATIKNFLKTTPSFLSASDELSKFDDTNVVFDLEVPKN